MEFSYPPVHTNAPKLKSDCYKPMAVLLQLRELVAARLPTSLEELTRIARVIRLALASTAMLALGPTDILPVALATSRGYGDFCGDALAVAAGEGAALCCGVTPVPGAEGCAVAEGETFAALAAGVVPGEPVAGATDAAGAAAGIPINSRCKLLSLALRRA